MTNIVNIFSLQGQNIIITGASSGIGRQCAATCRSQGANVFLLSRNAERLNELKNQIGPSGCECYAIDLKRFEEYEGVIQDIVSRYGKVTGFIHSAGIDVTIPVNSLKSETIKEVFDINVFAFFEFSRILSKNKYSCEHASYIAISSVMSFLAQKGKMAYCASKAALTNGVKVLALELANKNIRVNAVSPAIVKTAMVEELFSKIPQESIREIERLHPLGFGSPDDVANACVFLLSNASKWVTGSNLIVDGGYSIQ